MIHVRSISLSRREYWLNSKRFILNGYNTNINYMKTSKKNFRYYSRDHCLDDEPLIGTPIHRSLVEICNSVLSGFEMVEKRLVCNESIFQMVSEIWDSNHFRTSHNACFLVFVCWLAALRPDQVECVTEVT